DTNWDGKKIVVVGTYNMSSDYPFKTATGVAVKFMDAFHMQQLANLMRDDVSFVEADSSMPEVLEYAATHAPWPNPASIGIVNGMGVVVFSENTGTLH
ncbi:MAG: hypothetical protein ABFS45_25705, partial [Pseudomonadota bacterium]